MARVKDLWFSDVPKKDDAGKTVRSDDGRVVYERKKTAKHPDRGGNKNAKRWLACWFNPDGKEETKAYSKQTEAKAYAEKMEADAQRGLYVDPKAGQELFGPLAEKWLRLSDIGSTTRVKYESAYRNQVKPTFAGRRLKAVKPSDILEWLNSAEMKQLAGGTRRIAFVIVRAVFDLGVADKMIHENPTRSKIIDPPKDDPKPRQPWTSRTVWRVRDELPEYFRPVLDCQAGMGMRQNEALALAEEDFDFAAMKVHVRRQISLTGGKSYFKLPKEGRDRWVPLPTGLAAIVQAHIKANPPTPYELPWIGEDGTVASEPHVCKLLFRWTSSHQRTNGKHVKAALFRDDVWNPALVRAGLLEQPEGKLPKTRFNGSAEGNGTHIVRHFYATTLQDAGISPVGVTSFMGHSIKALPVTFRVYGHVTEETFDQAREAIDRSLFRIRPVPSAGTVAELRAAR
jgi:integrase